MKDDLKTFWNIGLAVVTLVIGYLVFPLSGQVDENRIRINELHTRLSVAEVLMTEMNKKLDKILERIDD